MKINTHVSESATGTVRRRPPLPARITLAAAALAFLGACGGPPPPAVGPGSELALRTSYQCTAEPLTRVVAAPAEIVDVARLDADVREVLAEAGRASANVLLTLSFEADGLNVERTVIAHDLAPALTDTLQKLVFAHLLRAPAAERPWGVRLRIAADPAVRLFLEPREYCPPRPRSPELEGAIAQYTGSGVRYRQGERERVVLLQVQVHPAGYVESARIVRGAPSGGTLERQLSDFARRFSFLPASIDGIPIRGVIAFPVRMPA